MHHDLRKRHSLNREVKIAALTTCHKNSELDVATSNDTRCLYGNLTKVGPSARAEAPPKVVSNHEYYWTGAAWRCRRCLLQAQAKSHEGKHGQCPGHSSTLRRVIQEGAGNGHTMSVSSDQKANSNINVSGIMVIYCSNCGKYTDRVAREILEPCTHQQTTGSGSCLRKIGRGQHPTKKHIVLGPPQRIRALEAHEITSEVPSFSDPYDDTPEIEPEPEPTVATISSNSGSGSVLVGLVLVGQMVGSDAASGGVAEVIQILGFTLGFLASMSIACLARYLDVQDVANSNGIQGTVLIAVALAGALV